MLFFPEKYLGRTFKGYRILHVLGQGRYGSCFTAEAPDGSTVVLKRFHPRMKKKNTGKNHFEPVILSSIEHPSIPSLLGIINEGRDYFFILEYMPGDSLETMLFKTQYQFSKKEVFQLGRQLIELIAYLHQKGIVHRDIRIANILHHRGQLSLVDFGLARFSDQEQYPPGTDFSYLGDVLLYLLYSSYSVSKKANRPWYEELPLTSGQAVFLKRLLGIEPPYHDISQIQSAFPSAFSSSSANANLAGTCAVRS